MRALSPSLRRAAELIATGQILLIAPAEKGHVGLQYDPLVPARQPEISGCTYAVSAFDVPEVPANLEKPKEPWRRGRPLR